MTIQEPNQLPLLAKILVFVIGWTIIGGALALGAMSALAIGVN